MTTSCFYLTNAVTYMCFGVLLKGILLMQFPVAMNLNIKSPPESPLHSLDQSQHQSLAFLPLLALLACCEVQLKQKEG